MQLGTKAHKNRSMISWIPQLMPKVETQLIVMVHTEEKAETQT